MQRFAENLRYSEEVRVEREVLAKIKAAIPAARAYRFATPREDRNGTDLWVHRLHGLPSVSVDWKHRRFCPVERYGRDDLCIETTSVYTGPRMPPWQERFRERVGWTLDATKRTDLVVYTWPKTGGARRVFIAYFPLLCAAAQRLWRTWVLRYGEVASPNLGYLTLSVFVPRQRVIAAMRRLQEGG